MTTTEHQTTAHAGSSTDIGTRNNDVESIIDQFMSAWNATTPEQRSSAVRAAWADSATLTDPLGSVTGHDDIVAFIDQAVTQFPGHRFLRTSAGDVNHGYVRFGWQLDAPDGTTVTDGVEIAKLADDGRFSGTLGFFGPLPPLEATQ